MPKYFFHLFNDETALDQEGRELSNDADALHHAAGEARTMAAESVAQGHLVLNHRIDVTRDDGLSVGSVRFRDVVKVIDG